MGSKAVQRMAVSNSPPRCLTPDGSLGLFAAPPWVSLSKTLNPLMLLEAPPPCVCMFEPWKSCWSVFIMKHHLAAACRCLLDCLGNVLQIQITIMSYNSRPLDRVENLWVRQLLAIRQESFYFIHTWGCRFKSWCRTPKKHQRPPEPYDQLQGRSLVTAATRLLDFFSQ